MTRFTSLVTLSLAALLIAGGTMTMNGQTRDAAITVSVPFPFTVGTQSMRPGTYRFSPGSTPFLLSVFNVKTGDMQMFTVHPERQRSTEQRGHLLFGRFADRSVLNEVHFPGTDEWSELVQPRRSARMEAKQRPTDNAVAMAQP